MEPLSQHGRKGLRIMERLNVCSSEQSISADEDHVMQSIVYEQASQWTLSQPFSAFIFFPIPILQQVTAKEDQC